MKRIYIIAAVGMMGLMLAAGCKKDDGVVTLNARIADGGNAKVYIDGELYPCWHNDDLVRVNDQVCATSAALGMMAQIKYVVDDGETPPSAYWAIYPDDIVPTSVSSIANHSSVTVALDDVQVYEKDSYGDQKVKIPMGAMSENTELTFHNLCSLLKVVVSSEEESFVLRRIEVTAPNHNLCGAGTATLTGSENDCITMPDGNNNNTVSLVFNGANRQMIVPGDRNTYVYYIVLPAFGSDNLTITLYDNRERSKSISTGTVSLAHNQIATVHMPVDGLTGDEELPVGALWGKFSISETQQVRFSKGNLQYCANTATWRFAEHQYDYVGGVSVDDGEIYGNVSGSDNGDISTTYSGWIDLFGWGTGDNPTNVSDDIDDYPSFVEWGLNAISNGGNAQSSGWRTMTSAEWNYLIDRNYDGEQYHVFGMVNGVRGLLLLPDDWYDNNAAPVSNHNYTVDEWMFMEDEGAVFLPAAGARVSNDDEDDERPIYYYQYDSYVGCYWVNGSINDADEAEYIDFVCVSGNLSIYSDCPAIGYSVRLVKDCTPSAGSKVSRQGTKPMRKVVAPVKH